MWKTITPGAPSPASPREALLNRAIAAAPHDAQLHTARAILLHETARHTEAAAAFETAATLDANTFAHWPAFATATLYGRGAAAALTLCDTKWNGKGTPAWHYIRGRALRRRKHHGQAQAEFHQAIALGDPDRRAMRALLGMHARASNGTPLLEACDAAPPTLQATAGILAYRALALSLLGRATEAATLIDLDAATTRTPFTPPPEFGDLATFNQALAAAILADRPPDIAASSDAAANYDMPLAGNAHLAALQTFIRAEVETYLAKLAGKGALSHIRQTLADTRLSCGAVVLRQQGRHGQHIHKKAWLSCVYHVQVPPTPATTNAGALMLGVCDEIAPGHRASWGQRSLPAIPGMLTIFPAHFWHDVAPTGSDQPRIAIVADLLPTSSPAR